MIPTSRRKTTKRICRGIELNIKIDTVKPDAAEMKISYSEAVMDKVAELVKAGKAKEISDMRDETDLNGLKLTIDLKRGTDPEKLMQKLFKTTTLQDSFGCNFNILIGGMPRVLGVRENFEEWTAWRCECVRRRV